MAESVLGANASVLRAITASTEQEKSSPAEEATEWAVKTPAATTADAPSRGEADAKVTEY